MIQIEQLAQGRQLVPFLWTALGWLVVGGSILGVPAARDGAWGQVGWFSLFCGLGLLNLFLLLKVVASLLSFVSETDGSKRLSAQKSLGIWFLSKMGGLSLLVTALLLSHSASLLGVALGLGVFVVVPVVGGLWWGRQLSTVESPEYVC